MAKDVTTRVNAWVARMQGEAVSPITARLVAPAGDVNSAVVNLFQSTTEALVGMETGIRNILDGAGVPTMLYPFYLSFAREIWALYTKGYNVAEGSVNVGGVQCNALRAKWTTRGLTGGILQAIQAEISGLGAGVAPLALLLPGDQTGVAIPITLSVTARGSAQNYHYRVMAGSGETGIIVAETQAAPGASWLVSPALQAGQFFTWNARVQVGGVWSPFNSNGHTFYTLP